MEFIQSLNPMTIIILLAATAIIVLSLFAKAIKGLLKIGIITTMIAVILYFLRVEGIL